MSREQSAAVSDGHIVSMARVAIRRDGDFDTARIAELLGVGLTKVRRVLRAADRDGGLGRTCVTVLSSGRRCGALLPREAWGRLRPRSCAAHTTLGVVSPPVAPAESIADAGTGEVIERSREVPFVALAYDDPRLAELEARLATLPKAAAPKAPTMPEHVATALDELTVEVVEGEPRASAFQLAELLGFGRDRDIKKLIDRNREELEVLGGICVRAIVSRTQMPTGGTRETEVDVPWLNRTQCLIVAMKAATPAASEARVKIAKSFEREQDRAARPATTPPALDSALAPIVAELVRSQQQTTQVLAGITATLAALAAPRTRPAARLSATASTTQLALGAYAQAFDANASAARKGDRLSVSEIAMRAGFPMWAPCRERSKAMVVRWLKRAGHWQDPAVGENVTMGLVADGRAFTRDHWVYDPKILNGADLLRYAAWVLSSRVNVDAAGAFNAAREIIDGAGHAA